MSRRARKQAIHVGKNYFNLDTQNAILDYIKSDSDIERNKIYTTYLEYPFNKLAEILIHKGKFYYAGNNLNEIKSDVLMHIFEKLSKYNENKGKAYSYFTVIVWRFLININNTNYQKIKTHISDDEDSSGEMKKEEYDILVDEQNKLDKSEFLTGFLEYIDENLARLFPKRLDLNIASALVEILKRRESLDKLDNKKALYIYIKEITDCKSCNITPVVSSFKHLYKKILNDFLDNGYISKSKNYK